MGSLLGGGQSQSQAAAQPPFHRIPIFGDKGIVPQAINEDILNYTSAFDEWKAQFPGLAAARQSDITDAYKQLTGPLSPQYQQEFMNAATGGAESAFGGGNPMSALGLQTGSAARGAQSAGFTKQVLGKQDQDIARINQLEQANPMLPVGLGPSDVLSAQIYNTNAQNASLYQGFANQQAIYNSQLAQNNNAWQGVGNLISGLGGIYSQYANSGFGGSGPVSNVFSTPDGGVSWTG